MPFTPSPPNGEWDFSCRPVGAQLWACNFLILCVGLAAGTGEYLLGTGGDSLDLGVPALILIGAMLIRARRIGVWADRDKVVVQNFWKTYAFDWTDVSRIEVRLVLRNSSGSPYPVRWWIFRMHDGHGVIAQALPFLAPDEKTHDLATTARTRVAFDGDAWSA